MVKDRLRIVPSQVGLPLSLADGSALAGSSSSSFHLAYSSRWIARFHRRVGLFEAKQKLSELVEQANSKLVGVVIYTYDTDRYNHTVIRLGMTMKKTGDQPRGEPLRYYQREYARLKARLREIGFICEGTVVERWMQCGKPNCACARNRARLHGPYFQLSWKEKAKTMSRRLSAEHAALYRQWIENRQRLQSIVQQMHGVSQKAHRHLLPAEKPLKAAPKPGDIPRPPR